MTRKAKNSREKSVLTPSDGVEESEGGVRVEDVDRDPWVQVEALVEEPVRRAELHKHLQAEESLASPFLDEQ